MILKKKQAQKQRYIHTNETGFIDARTNLPFCLLRTPKTEKINKCHIKPIFINISLFKVDFSHKDTTIKRRKTD